MVSPNRFWDRAGWGVSFDGGVCCWIEIRVVFREERIDKCLGVCCLFKGRLLMCFVCVSSCVVIVFAFAPAVWLVYKRFHCRLDDWIVDRHRVSDRIYTLTERRKGTKCMTGWMDVLMDGYGSPCRSFSLIPIDLRRIVKYIKRIIIIFVSICFAFPLFVGFTYTVLQLVFQLVFTSLYSYL